MNGAASRCLIQAGYQLRAGLTRVIITTTRVCVYALDKINLEIAPGSCIAHPYPAGLSYNLTPQASKAAFCDIRWSVTDFLPGIFCCGLNTV